ncbi:MAG: hypothetical protein ABJK28_01035 [Algibacter sp.]
MKSIKMKTILTILTSLIVLMVLSTNVNAQELKVEAISSVNINELPEYVVVTSENTKLIGGININIDYKKSNYEGVLKELESLLQNRKKLSIRTQTDLLNAMSKLGFTYVNAYNGKAGSLGLSSGKNTEIFGSQEKYRINMVFKKKEKYQS